MGIIEDMQKRIDEIERELDRLKQLIPGGQSAIIEVKNIINGHEYVDLGLPSGLKWATCNVGANSPGEYGDYFAWGEIESKSCYTEDNSKTYEKEIADISGNPKFDVAASKWGGTWRMPTVKEIKELIDRCIWTWTSKEGNYGYEVTGPNGNSIFLPAVGYRYESSLYDAGSSGYYWSSTPRKSDSSYSYVLLFYSSSHRRGNYYRYYGQSVRPVSE